jgi:2-keto-4-pentenoate hydratase/2-oxohepta-3-ene-1,7-dioic acid hydratase in catechol pathway
MRWIRFSTAGRHAAGIVEGDSIAETDGNMFGEWRPTGAMHRLADVTIEVPNVPPTFYAAGLNYAKHVLEGAARRGETASLPKAADIGYRANNALVAHGQDVIIPADADDAIHYEGELAVIIGKRTKNVPEAEAMGCIFGYSIGNDVSERDWQKHDRTFFRAKNTDTFKPMGPWIETALDLDAAETIVRVNGTETIRFATNALLFSIATFISRTSRYCTFVPGDMIWMGTDGTSPNIKSGDVVEIDITGIGTLRNRFVRRA